MGALATAMPTNSTALTIPGELPATPLVLLAQDTIARIETLTASASALKALTSPAEMHTAAQLLREISGLSKDIEKARLEVTRPFLDFQRKIKAAADEQTVRLTAAERTLRTNLTTYQVEQERIQLAEAKRQREEQERIAAAARKLEEDRARAAKEAAERAAAEAALAASAEADLVDTDDEGMADLAAEIEEDDMAIRAAEIAAKATQLAAVRSVIAPPPVGISYRTTLKYTVVDVRRLSTNLVTITPNDAEIRRLFVTGWKDGDAIPTVPGILFTPDKQVVARR